MEWETYALLSLADTEAVQAEDLEPSEPPPPRFNKPVGYIRTVTGMLRDFGTLPRAGGLNDQSAATIRDMITWMNGQNYWMWEIKKKIEAARRNSANEG